MRVLTGGKGFLFSGRFNLRLLNWANPRTVRNPLRLNNINTKLPSVISSKFDLIFKQTRPAKYYLFIWRGVEHSGGVQYASQSRVESTDKQVEGRHDHGEAHVDVIDDDRRGVVLVKMQTTVTHQVEGQAQDAHQDLPDRTHTNRCWVSVRSNYRSSTKW